MASDLEYEVKSAWNAYLDEDIHAFAARYIEFLSACKTERETIAWIRAKLEKAGFSEDMEKDAVFRSFRDKTLFAARRGSEPLSSGLRLIAAHVDCPRLDFKQHPFIEQAGVAQAKTHYYGGIRKYQWLARPLALHGVIVLENGEKISLSIGEKEGDPVFCIADLLPHLAKKQSEQKLNEVFEAEKLNVIIAHEPCGEEKKGEEDKKDKNPVKARLLDFLYKNYNIKEEDFITAELEAVPAGPAVFVGFDQALIGGYGHDDRICVFCALEAFLNAAAVANRNNIAVMFWDKEEIGSDGATGASSRFFNYCVDDLKDAWAPDLKTSRILLASRAICADVTAALDPDFQEVHEKQNAAIIGRGPCFSKFTGSGGKYGASEADAEFFACMRGLLNKKAIPWQAAELGKVDLGGGGTVALFMAAYGMHVIDFGPALLSMHSPFELASAADLYAACKAYQAFYED